MARHLAQLFANALKRRGRVITLRTVTMGAGGPIPALLSTPVLMSDLLNGATAFNLACTSASGSLMPGDVIAFGAAKVTVAAPVQATPLSATSSPGFIAVQLSEPYSGATIPAGTAASLTFAADVPIYAMVNAYPVNLVDGKLIEAFDLRVVIAAWQQATPDPATQKLVIDGQVRSILRVDPTYGPGGELEKWAVQAR
jgi:hypothetical protein